MPLFHKKQDENDEMKKGQQGEKAKNIGKNKYAVGGAVIGTFFGPGIGTAAGAGLGHLMDKHLGGQEAKRLEAERMELDEAASRVKSRYNLWLTGIQSLLNGDAWGSNACKYYNIHDFMKTCDIDFRNELKDDGFSDILLDDYIKMDEKYSLLSEMVSEMLETRCVVLLNETSNEISQVFYENYGKVPDTTISKLKFLGELDPTWIDCAEKAERLDWIDPHFSICLHSTRYGKLNESTLAEIPVIIGFLTEELRQQKIDFMEMLVGDKPLFLLRIDAWEPQMYLWYYANLKPFDAETFSRLNRLCAHLWNSGTIEVGYKQQYFCMGLEAFLSEVWSSKEMGRGVIAQKRKFIEDYVNWAVSTGNTKLCWNLASAFMAFDLAEWELAILHRMAAARVPMDSDLQRRLAFLESGGDKGPQIAEVGENLDADTFIFDYMSVSWNLEDYDAFFKKLAFEDKKLLFALTVREYAKNLLLPGGVKADTEMLLVAVKDNLREEYEDSIRCEVSSGMNVSDESATSKKYLIIKPIADEMGFDYCGLMLSVIPQGKNLNIRIYTLFLPDSGDTVQQEKRACSLKKNANPDIIAFEEGVRESMLSSLERAISDIISIPKQAQKHQDISGDEREF